MAHTPRRPTPQGKDTGPTGKTAHRPLQRRLRHALGYVDWADVAVATLLCVAQDTLGGSAAVSVLLELLAALLP